MGLFFPVQESFGRYQFVEIIKIKVSYLLDRSFQNGYAFEDAKRKAARLMLHRDTVGSDPWLMAGLLEDQQKRFPIQDRRARY
jgi:hypothetical protein